MKIKPISTGIDKVILNGVCKDELTTVDADGRIVGKKEVTITENGKTKKAIKFLYGEQRKTEEYMVPILGKINQYREGGIIQNYLNENMRMGKANYNCKFVLTNDFGQLYNPSTIQSIEAIPFRYEFNPNKALRNGSSFIGFFNELISTAEHLEIPELHINFDFKEDLSKYIVLCLNPSRKHDDSKENTKYIGYQQKAPVRHAWYDKVSEMKAKGKNVDHLPSTYYRYEIRLRNTKTVTGFITNVTKREKILSELVFLKEIQTECKCTQKRAAEVFQVINGDLCLSVLNTRAKKEVTAILRQLNEVDLSFDVENLTPYINVCKGESLKEKDLPNVLIGETMVYSQTNENHAQISYTEDSEFVKNNSITNGCLGEEKLEHFHEKSLTLDPKTHSLSGEKLEHFLLFQMQYLNKASPLIEVTSVHSATLTTVSIDTLSSSQVNQPLYSQRTIGCRSP